MTLVGSLKSRYPHNSERSQLIRAHLEEACTAFIDAGYGDSNAMQKTVFRR